MVKRTRQIVILTICIFGPLLSGACAPQNPAQQAAANRIIVTGTDSLPGKRYEVLGMVRINGDTIYDDCQSPSRLALKAVQTYGASVDAIIAFRSTNSNCEQTSMGSVCFTACEGTAVQFSRTHD